MKLKPEEQAGLLRLVETLANSQKQLIDGLRPFLQRVDSDAAAADGEYERVKGNIRSGVRRRPRRPL